MSRSRGPSGGRAGLASKEEPNRDGEKPAGGEDDGPGGDLHMPVLGEGGIPSLRFRGVVLCIMAHFSPCGGTDRGPALQGDGHQDVLWREGGGPSHRTLRSKPTNSKVDGDSGKALGWLATMKRMSASRNSAKVSAASPGIKAGSIQMVSMKLWCPGS